MIFFRFNFVLAIKEILRKEDENTAVYFQKICLQRYFEIIYLYSCKCFRKSGNLRPKFRCLLIITYFTSTGAPTDSYTISKVSYRILRGQFCWAENASSNHRPKTVTISGLTNQSKIQFDQVKAGFRFERNAKIARKLNQSNKMEEKVCHMIPKHSILELSFE